MAEAQGISKQLSYKAQSALGTAASGSGGQLLRRRTFVGTYSRDTYTSDEIVSHQQSTGATAGIKRASATLSALLSCGTYQDLFANLLRKAWAATSALTGLSITVAGSGPTYTITRASGDFLTGGIKAGDVVRLTAGSFNAANLNKNLLVVSLTSTVLTVRPLNGVALTAEGPISSATVTVPGKRLWVPDTGHTNTYLTIEEFYTDLTRSELYTDMKVASAAVNLPATGNAETTFNLVGLNRTTSGTRSLSSPTAETSTSVLTAVNGGILINGVLTPLTGLQMTIDGTIAPSDAEIGSDVASDLQKGRIMVSGSFTAKFTSNVLQALYENQTVIQLVAVISDGTAANADFISFSLPTIKLFSDNADDGEKSVIRSYSFTAQYNGLGGSGQSTEKTILTIQDSVVA
jgi:hypothetical protein